MDQKPHTLLAIFEAKPGKEQALKDMLISLIAPTRQEPGCLNYDLHQSQTNPAQFMFYENWVDAKAHAAHCQTEHIQRWRANKDELLANTSYVSAWQLVDGG